MKKKKRPRGEAAGVGFGFNSTTCRACESTKSPTNQRFSNVSFYFSLPIAEDFDCAAGFACHCEERWCPMQPPGAIVRFGKCDTHHPPSDRPIRRRKPGRPGMRSSHCTRGACLDAQTLFRYGQDTRLKTQRHPELRHARTHARTQHACTHPVVLSRTKAVASPWLEPQSHGGRTTPESWLRLPRAQKDEGGC